MTGARSFVVDDREKGIFLLDREALVSDDVLRAEMRNIFAKCWIYVGHASELKRNGDFHTRKVAGRPVIFARDGKGAGALPSSTPAAIAARWCAPSGDGNTRRFNCVYHGWIYNNDGSLARVPGDEAYTAAFDKSTFGLKAPARFEQYQGLLVHEPRRGRAVARRLSRQGDRLHRPRRRPVAVRADGSDRRHAGIRRQRQLEADGREQRRRLPPALDAFDVAQLHGQFRREGGAAEGPVARAADARPRDRSRQRPFHHRQRQLPRPSGRRVDSDLRRRGQARNGRRSARSWSSASGPIAPSASATPTATS